MAARPTGKFPAAQRVKKRAEYVALQALAQRVTTPRFTLLIAARPDDGAARLGVTVSRKIGNAVARNRMKRLLREAFRATRELWPAGIDVAIIAKRPPARSGLEDVVTELHGASRSITRRCREAERRPLPPGAP